MIKHRRGDKEAINRNINRIFSAVVMRTGCDNLFVDGSLIRRMLGVKRSIRQDRLQNLLFALSHSFPFYMEIGEFWREECSNLAALILSRFQIDNDTIPSGRLRSAERVNGMNKANPGHYTVLLNSTFDTDCPDNVGCWSDWFSLADDRYVTERHPLASMTAEEVEDMVSRWTKDSMRKIAVDVRDVNGEQIPIAVLREPNPIIPNCFKDEHNPIRHAHFKYVAASGALRTCPEAKYSQRKSDAVDKMQSWLTNGKPPEDATAEEREFEEAMEAIRAAEAEADARDRAEDAAEDAAESEGFARNLRSWTRSGTPQRSGPCRKK